MSSRRRSGGSENEPANLSADDSARIRYDAAMHLGVSSRDIKTLSGLISTLGKERLLEVAQEEVNKQKEKDAKDHRPSDLTHRSQWKGIQFNDKGAPKFICYRGPREACPAVPLVLLHKSFLDFCENAESFDVEARDMKAALDLWNFCSEGWDCEVQEMSPALNEFFSKYFHLWVSPAGIDGKTADGLVEGKMTLFEYKIEPADGWFQGLDYFRRRFAQAKVIGLENSHGLLVLLTCPYIQVVAVVMDWQQNKVLAEPLTSFQNCFGPEYKVKQLASLLRALRIFTNDFIVDPEINPHVPFVFRDKTVGRLKGRLVYQLEADKVGKLARGYCEEAHRCWAGKNVAPPLYAVTPIGNGWLLVVMAYLGSEDGWMDGEEVVASCKDDPASLGKLLKNVKDAVDKGHNTGYVHGDLRLPNIKIRPKFDFYEIMFLDFDWAGKIGRATYPALLNPDLGWHQDAEYGSKIEVDHDLHFACNLVEQLH